MWSLLLYVACVVTGIAFGYALPVFQASQKVCMRIGNTGLYIIILLLGFKLGSDQDLFLYLPTIGLQSLIMAVSVIVGSIAVICLFQKLLNRHKIIVYHHDDSEVTEPKKEKMWIFTVTLIGILVIGVIFARMLLLMRQSNILAWFEKYQSICLTVLLCTIQFSSGFATGQRKGIINDIKRSGWALLVTPMGVLIGSVLAAVLVGFLMKLGLVESAIVGGTCGWYSLISITLSEVNAQLAALAFLTNMLREIIGILIVPFVNKHFGPLAAIAPIGAAAMDTGLPALTRTIGIQNSLLAFSSGLLLTIIVPFFISFLMPLLV